MATKYKATFKNGDVFSGELYPNGNLYKSSYTFASRDRFEGTFYESGAASGYYTPAFGERYYTHYDKFWKDSPSKVKKYATKYGGY